MSEISLLVLSTPSSGHPNPSPLVPLAENGDVISYAQPARPAGHASISLREFATFSVRRTALIWVRFWRALYIVQYTAFFVILAGGSLVDRTSQSPAPSCRGITVRYCRALSSHKTFQKPALRGIRTTAVVGAELGGVHTQPPSCAVSATARGWCLARRSYVKCSGCTRFFVVPKADRLAPRSPTYARPFLATNAHKLRRSAQPTTNTKKTSVFVHVGDARSLHARMRLVRCLEHRPLRRGNRGLHSRRGGVHLW